MNAIRHFLRVLVRGPVRDFPGGYLGFVFFLGAMVCLGAFLSGLLRELGW
jgi:hypothetical protein